MRISVLILMLVLVLTKINGQSNKTLTTRVDSIEAIKNSMRENSIVSTSSIGLSLKLSFQYSRFLYLIRHLTKDDFYQLSYDANPSMRVYSYMGLLYLNSDQSKSVRKRLKDDFNETDIQD